MNLQTDFKNQMVQFLDCLFKDIQNAGLNVDRFLMDHVCYNTSSDIEYERMKKNISCFSELLHEAWIHNRPIATFELNFPILFSNRIIRIIELTAPKKDKKSIDGFEHVEFVVDESFQKISSQYPHIEWKLSNKIWNSELSGSLSAGRIKFHHIPLKSVVFTETNGSLFEFINNIFVHFSNYTPMISGSAPLNIHTETSDIDILFSSLDLIKFAEEMKSFLNLYEPIVKFKNLRGVESVIIRFQANFCRFEFVAQKKTIFESIAHQHFLIESRLLNISGEQARIQIQKMKKAGLATEPAFAQYFKIKEEPYETLFLWNQKTEKELFELISSRHLFQEALQ